MGFNKKIVGRIYPWHSRLLRALNDNALFLAWAKKNDDCRAFSARDGAGALREFYEYIDRTIAGGGQPVDYLEFGVAGGRSLRLWSQVNSHSKSRFFGFDSFEGLPDDWEWALGGMPKGAFSTHGQAPDIGDERVNLIKGLFQDSLPPFLESFMPRSPLIVHLDCDLYSSALYCLTQLDWFLDGGVVIFDEFDNLLHEFAALRDYADSYRRSYRVLARFEYFKKIAIQVTGHY